MDEFEKQLIDKIEEIKQRYLAEVAPYVERLTHYRSLQPVTFIIDKKYISEDFIKQLQK